MVKIGVGDWLVSRSDNFKFLMSKLRDHQINTRKSFTKVKHKHRVIDKKFENQETRIKRIEKTIRVLREIPKIRVIRKRKKR